MTKTLFDLLDNQIDITRAPFSDRGSRLLIYQQPGQPRLYIRLAERLTSLEPGIESYLQRLPFIEDLSLVDDNGTPIDFETAVSPDKIELQTRVGKFELVFQDSQTLALGLPPNKTSGLYFRVHPFLIKNADANGAITAVRDISYATSGKFIEHRVTSAPDGLSVELIARAEADNAITIHVGTQAIHPKSIPPFSEIRDQARSRWLEWFRSVPDVIEPYRSKYAYAWWVMANNLVSPQGYVTHESMMPTKAFYWGIWLWDSALHAIALRHARPELARDQIRVMLSHQLPDGMLPDVVFDEGIVTKIDHPIRATVTKPPILAWAAWKIHQSDPDLDFLKEIYPALVHWNAWWFNNNHNDDENDGLAQYKHPYSSGLDDSPLWDQGMPVESPDINTYLSIQMDTLASIAKALEMNDESYKWQQRAKALVERMIADLWDDNIGLFWAFHNKERIRVVTPFNLYPLWTGQLPGPMRARIIAHLENPEEFWGLHPLPTVAYNDPAYNPETMWRGPIWANINYFFIEALNKVGRTDLANKLREKTLDLILNHPSIFEYYNSETGKAPAKAAIIFGWTAAVFIDLAIQATVDANLAKEQERNFKK